MATWRDDVTEALENLGGSGSLTQIYAEVRKLRPQPHPPSLEEIIRRTIEQASSDTQSYRGPDLYRSVDGLGSGTWALRSGATNVSPHPADPVVFRLNVGASQLGTAIGERVFSITARRKAMVTGSILLLQLNKGDADRLGEAGSRIRHALVFESAEPDPTGAITEEYWPGFQADLSPHLILRCSAVLPVKPFSFTAPPFSKVYRSLQNAIPLTLEDARLALARIEATGIDPRRPLEFDDDNPALPRDPLLKKAVERVAVDHIRGYLETRFPDPFEVKEMPPNNAGFDIQVLSGVETELFVEVKGTMKPVPFFMLSEVERNFSSANAKRYEIHVVWGIDPIAKTFSGVASLRGEVGRDTHGLREFRWIGQLSAVT